MQQAQDAAEDTRRQREMRRVQLPDQRAEDRKSKRGSAGIVEQTFAGTSTGFGWSVAENGSVGRRQLLDGRKQPKLSFVLTLFCFD